MEKEIYNGKIKNVDSGNLYSPEGFNELMKELEKSKWVAEISESERATYNDGGINYLHKRKTKDVDIFYSFKGKKISGEFTGEVKFILSSENLEKISELEKSIKEKIDLGEN